MKLPKFLLVSLLILNNLFVHTQLQSVYGINMVALAEGQPKTLNLKQFLEFFITHRREVVTRRTVFDLGKARDRIHILEGLAVALSNIDPMIALIKKAKDSSEAKANPSISSFGNSPFFLLGSTSGSVPTLTPMLWRYLISSGKSFGY